MTNITASELDRHFMRRAIELSLHAVERRDGNPFGSVVVRDGVVLGEGWNRIRASNDPSAHAEMEAIRNACQKISSPRLDGSVIYASGQPCPMCLSLIYLTGIEKVFFCIPGETMASLNPALSVQHVYEAIGRPPFERSIPEIQIMSGEVDAIMNRYRGKQ